MHCSLKIVQFSVKTTDWCLQYANVKNSVRYRFAERTFCNAVYLKLQYQSPPRPLHSVCSAKILFAVTHHRLQLIFTASLKL